MLQLSHLLPSTLLPINELPILRVCDTIYNYTTIQVTGSPTSTPPTDFLSGRWNTFIPINREHVVYIDGVYIDLSVIMVVQLLPVQEAV